ncbi:MAG: hypothetical protein AUK37_07330 [Rhodobacterales bacterium CG2_30_65_12]|nr:MAG: hypothetical protein AUK37_07330 [Rhodobacterales bacterium CG2_30_65_12]
MPRPFDYFVIFAEMRTGSNFLESNLDQFPGLKTYGEAFNPWFIVNQKQTELFGVTVDQRNADPLLLIERMKDNTDGIPGFRFFHDHDARVFEAVIDDPRCAKIVLTRNFIDAYVSRKIAWETDQWQLNDIHDVIKKRARFVPEEFAKLYFRITAFQQKVLRRLQASGQAAYYIDYDDIRDLGVINGLARYLGETTEISRFSDTFKKQNPEALEDKVLNYPVLEKTIREFNAYDFSGIPNFEPRRAAVVPSWVAAAQTPLMFLPIAGAPVEEIRTWLAAIDGVSEAELITGLTQRDLRKWKREHPGHRSFTVLRHPAARAHAAFCRHFLNDGPEAFHELRRALRQHYHVPLPEEPVPGADWDKEAHRAAFLAFLDFIKLNHEGQTTVRVDPSWASQGAVIQGFSTVLTPDHMLRENNLAEGLAFLGLEAAFVPPPFGPTREDHPFALADIYDRKIEKAVRAAYQRDYMLFGFKPWKKDQG